MERYQIKTVPAPPSCGGEDNEDDIFHSDEEDVEPINSEPSSADNLLGTSSQEEEEEEDSFHSAYSPEAETQPVPDLSTARPEPSCLRYKTTGPEPTAWTEYSTESDLDSDFTQNNIPDISWAAVEASWSEETAPTPAYSLDPKPAREPRASRRRQRKEEVNITSLVFEDYQPPPSALDQDFEDNVSFFSELSSSDSTSESEPTMSLPLDPLFAVQLQEAFGPPLEDSLLQFLNTDEILKAKIPLSLAHQFFLCWQDSLREYLSSKPDTVETVDTASSSEKPRSEAPFPKTVLAPNAVEYYDRKMLDKVINASLNPAAEKKVCFHFLSFFIRFKDKIIEVFCLSFLLSVK